MKSIAFPSFESRPASPRERIAALVLVIALAGAGAVLAARHPADLSLLPACPSRALLRLECPGCGSTRAVHHLLHGRVADAWRHNPAMILIGLPFLALLAVDLAGTLGRGRRVVLGIGGRTGIALAILLVAYMIARNLPLDALDALRPPPPATDDEKAETGVP